MPHQLLHDRLYVRGEVFASRDIDGVANVCVLGDKGQSVTGSDQDDTLMMVYREVALAAAVARTTGLIESRFTFPYSPAFG